MDDTRAQYYAHLPRCSLCGVQQGAECPVTVYECRHTICESCSKYNKVPGTENYICPWDQLFSQRLFDLRELSDLIYQISNTENVPDEVLEHAITKMREEINYSSPCGDQDCDRRHCKYLHEEANGPNPLDLLQGGLSDAPAAVNSDFPFPRLSVEVDVLGYYERMNPVQPELRLKEIGIASESLWRELSANNFERLKSLCVMPNVDISSCNLFDGKLKSSARWAYGSFDKETGTASRYFSTEESIKLEWAKENRKEECHCSIGKVIMRPLVLIVGGVAYVPVFRIVSFTSDPHFAQLTVDANPLAVEAFNRKIQELEVQQIVEKNVDGEALQVIAKKHWLHLTDSGRFYCLRGTLADVKSAMGEISAAQRIDNVRCIAINGDLTRMLAEQLAEKKHFLVLNNLIIGEKWEVYQSLLEVAEFDNKPLGLVLPPELQRQYHISLQGQKLTGSIEDIVEAAKSYDAQKAIVKGLSAAEPRVLELAGHLVEAQLLPPQDRFERWYFTQEADEEAVEVPLDSQVCAAIVNGLVDTGCLHRVLKVERVTSKPLYLRYLKQLYEIEQVVGNSPRVAELYHGPRIYKPMDMVTSRDGFARRAGIGSWGIGFYFAVRAPKAVHYAYRPPEAPNHMVISLCDVIIGETVHLKSDTRLRAPPDGYQSVLGKGRGSDLYIVYKPTMAHLKYIITLEANQ